MFIIHRNRGGKPTSESAVINHKIKILDEALPPGSVIFGGRILELVNQVALKVAQSHTEKKCITLGIDFIRYYAPIKKEDILTCCASVNKVWDNTLEVGVKVIAEDFRMLNKKDILSAYFTFKVEEEKSITKVLPENPMEKLRFIEAEKRKKIRIRRLKKKLYF